MAIRFTNKGTLSITHVLYCTIYLLVFFEACFFLDMQYCIIITPNIMMKFSQKKKKRKGKENFKILSSVPEMFVCLFVCNSVFLLFCLFKICVCTFYF